MGKATESHQEFGKYDSQGAYHWMQMRAHIRRYNAGLAGRYQMSIDLISRHCDAKDIASVLDIGCGDGYFTCKVAKLFPSATIDGFDFSTTGISLAREMCPAPNVKFHVGNAFDNASEKYSLITATDVIEHLTDHKDFLRLCHQSLKPNGFLMLSTPVRVKEVPDDPYHVHEFFKNELANTVSDAGFAVIEHSLSHDYQALVRYGKRFSLFGIGKMRLWKYHTNFMSLVLDRNPFIASNPMLPTMQYLMAVKA